jgi:hypothetical protein
MTTIDPEEVLLALGLAGLLVLIGGLADRLARLRIRVDAWIDVDRDLIRDRLESLEGRVRRLDGRLDWLASQAIAAAGMVVADSEPEGTGKERDAMTVKVELDESEIIDAIEMYIRAKFPDFNGFAFDVVTLYSGGDEADWDSAVVSLEPSGKSAGKEN